MRYVYFVQAEDGPIKIGVSKRPAQRLAQLQIGNPRTLRLTRIEKAHDAFWEEGRLRDIFNAYQIDGRQEWFHPTPALAAIADAVPGDGPDALPCPEYDYF